MKNYYDTLGVSKEASQDDIKKAFRKLAHQHHPDKSGGDDKKFKEINEAYQVISDEQKRKAYDQYGPSFDQMGRGGGASWQDYAHSQGFGFDPNNIQFDFGDLGDVFGDFFGFGGTARRGGRRAPSRGKDIQMELTIDFHESLFGVKKEVKLFKSVLCQKCKGNGAEPGTKITTCTTCKGAGEVTMVQRTILGNIQTRGICSECRGEGSKIEKKCHECGGSGAVRTQEVLDVSIPAGIDNGNTIRLQSQGEAGSKGAPNGDLYITIRVKADKRFTRKENSLLVTLPLQYSQVALGDSVALETFDGTLTLKIPSGTQTGKVFRVAQYGVPYLHKQGRGDLLVTVVLKTPEKLSRQQKELIEKLKHEGL